MANGRIATGFSMPRVAKYSASGTTVTYSNVMALARGVEVTLSPESSDDNKFFADNVASENSGVTFTGGTVSLTVDGLKDAARRFIFGLPAEENGWTDYGDSMEPPYIGIGYITRYMEDGVTSYVPTVIPKTRFSLPERAAATQEDEIDWQTEELEAAIFRSDDANRTWLSEGIGYSTEDDALAALEAKLGASAST